MTPGSPPDIALRPTGREDAARIGALLEACYPVLMAQAYPAAVLSVALPLMTRANPALLASGTYFVAETPDGQAVACGGWTPNRPGTGEVAPGLGHVRHFATHPDWLGRGLGRAIFRACEAQAREAGVRRFECYASLNAVPFYAALGFRPIGPTEVALAPNVRFASELMTLG